MTYQDLLGEPKWIAVELAPGKKLEFSYFPHFFTDEFEERLDALGMDENENEDEDSEARRAKVVQVNAPVTELLGMVVADWRVKGLKYSPEALRRLDATLKYQMLGLVMQDVRGKAPTTSGGD